MAHQALASARSGIQNGVADAVQSARRLAADRDIVALARYGLVFLALTIPLQRATVIGQVGSIVSLAAMAVVPLALWAGWVGGRQRALMATPLVFAVALTWWAGASYLWSVNPEATWGEAVRLASVVVTAVAILGLAHDHALRLRLLGAYVVGSVAASLLIIQEFLAVPTAQRYSLGPDASINQVAFTLVLALVPTAYLLARALREGDTGGLGLVRRQWHVAAYGSAYSVILIGILLSGSRSAAGLSLLATVAAMLLIATAANSVAGAVKGIASLLLLGVVLTSALSLADAPPLERAFGQEGGSLQEEARADILARAWELSAERPVIGAGLASGVALAAPGWSHVARNPHNTHMQVFLELGVVGAALWLLLIVAVVRAAWAQPPFERLMWGTQLAVLLVGIGARGFIVGVPMWLFFALVSAADNYPPEVPRPRVAPGG